MKKITWVILSFGVLGGGIAHLLGNRTYVTKSCDPEIVKMVYFPVAPYLLFVAMDHDIFKKQGLQIEPALSKKSDEALESLFTGKVDATDGIELYGLVPCQQLKPDAFKVGYRNSTL